MSFFKRDTVTVVSEIGINHDGSLEKAIEMIDASASCGADICKFQLLKAHQMYHLGSGNYVNESGTFPIYDVIKKHEMPEEWIPRLMEECSSRNLGFLMTICDHEGLDEMLRYNPECLKIASSEISFLNLFKRIGETGVPLIFSSAAAGLGDIEEALNAYGDPASACIMQCVGKYPATPEMSNLNILRTLQLAFPETSIGLSDHTEEPALVPVAAVALGARVIEKHFTLDKTSPGPDHFFALDPEGMSELVRSIRDMEKCLEYGEDVELDPTLLGTSRKSPLPEEHYLRRFCFRSLFARTNLKKGELFTHENIAVLRAGELESGLHPRFLEELIGLPCSRDLAQGTPITFENLLSR
jgi:sialic acid synthase SpsE